MVFIVMSLKKKFDIQVCKKIEIEINKLENINFFVKLIKDYFCKIIVMLVLE